MLASLAACFGVLPSSTATPGGTRYDKMTGGHQANVKPGCIFCFVSVERGFAVVFEDDELIAFRDRNPAAEQHLLVIPRHHIDSVKSLTREHVDLLSRMESLGERLLDECGVRPEDQWLGYHIPPFSSVPHIHLHALSLPLKSPWRRLKYRSTSLSPTQGISPAFRADRVERGMDGVDSELVAAGKKWGWFVSSGDARRIVEAGGRIGVRGWREGK